MRFFNQNVKVEITDLSAYTPVVQHVVGRTTLVTRPMEPVHRDVTQDTQGDSVKIPVALHVVGRTTLVTRPMEPVHRDVTQDTQGDSVKIPVAPPVEGGTTLVARLMEPVCRDVTQATQGGSVRKVCKSDKNLKRLNFKKGHEGQEYFTRNIKNVQKPKTSVPLH